MRIEFTYTLADLDEGIVPERYAADPRAFRRKLTGGLLGWAACIACALFLLWSDRSDIRSRPEKPLPQDLISTMGPNVLAAAILFIATVIQLFSQWRRARWRTAVTRKSSSSGTRRTRIILLTFVAFGCSMAIAFFPDRRPSIWRATSGQLLLANLIPWVIVLAVFLLLSALRMRWRTRQLWLANPGFQRQQVVELNDSQFRLMDGVSDVRFAWNYFAQAWETPNLLVLVDENKARRILPKRAFASESEVGQARALLQNKISQVQFLVKPLGFPVAPRQVLPIEHPAEATEGDQR